MCICDVDCFGLLVASDSTSDCIESYGIGVGESGGGTWSVSGCPCGAWIPAAV